MIRCEPLNPTWLCVSASSPAEHAFIGTLPGAQRSKGQWLVPADLGETLGYSPTQAPQVTGINRELHPYQVDGVQRLLHYGSQLLAFETRLGKSGTFIEACRLRYERTDLGSRPVPGLIVCPSLALGVWADQFERWWPGHPPVVLVSSSEELWETMKRGPGEGVNQWAYMIISYGLIAYRDRKKNMQENLKLLSSVRWNAIALDEVHRIKSSDTQISQALAQISANKPYAMKAALSATPIDNEPPDLWHIMQVLRPGVLGSEYRYNKRYSLSGINDHGYKMPPKGLNPEHAEELASRIRFFCLRATKAEWGHLFPPLNPMLVRITPEKKPEWRKLLDTWSGEKNLHEKTLDAYFQRAGNMKIGPAVEMALDARKTKTHLLVATYFHETCHEVTRLLQEAGETVIEITGKTPAIKRKKILEEAAKLPTCCVVVSMKSVSEALEISFCTGLLVVELSPVPKDMEQLCGRVHSMHSKGPVDIWILLLRGSLDEVLANKLHRRLDDINTLIGGGYSAKKITAALKERTPSRAEVMRELLEAAKSRVEDDPYV
mgnify:CR=1 FL=1